MDGRNSFYLLLKANYDGDFDADSWFETLENYVLLWATLKISSLAYCVGTLVCLTTIYCGF